MKKVFVVLGVIFSLFLMVGCNDNQKIEVNNDYIMLSLAFSEEGVKESITYSVNSDKIKKLSKDNEYFDFLSNLVGEVEEIRKEFLFSLALKYLDNPNEEYKLNKGVVLTNTVYSSDSDCIGFNIVFTSLNAWNYYHQSEKTDDKTESTNKGNLFYTKVQSSSIFPFSEKIKDEGQTIGERYRQRYLACAKGLSFEEKLNDYKPDFIYNYSSIFSKLNSNANYKFSQNNMYFHVWRVLYENLNQENNITFSIVTIGYGWWYLLLLVVVLFILAISLTIYFIKKRVKNKFKNK